MYRIYFFSFLISFSFVSCGDDCIDGDGIMMSKSGTLANFERIDIEGTIDVNLNYAVEPSYTLTGESNIISEIDVVSSNNSLSLNKNYDCVNTTQSLQLELFVPSISAIDLEGTSDLTGTTKFSFLEIMKSGTGDITLSGETVNNIIIVNSGTGDINLYDLESNTLTINSTGTGDSEVRVIETLTVALSGTGDIKYKGNPTITSEISGTGELINDN